MEPVDNANSGPPDASTEMLLEAGGDIPTWEALRRFRPCGSPLAFA